MKKFIILMLCLIIAAGAVAKPKKFRTHRMKKTAPQSGWVDNWQEYYQSKTKK